MQQTTNLENNVNQFLSYIALSDQKQLSLEIQNFFSNQDDTENKETIHDENSLLFFKNHCLVNQIKLDRDFKTDRIIKFDGNNISDLNPMAYIDTQNEQYKSSLQMKGDGMNSSSRRSGSSSSSSTSSNNNNNNNNS